MITLSDYTSLFNLGNDDSGKSSMGKRFETYFIKEGIQIAIKHMKKGHHHPSGKYLLKS